MSTQHWSSMHSSYSSHYIRNHTIQPITVLEGIPGTPLPVDNLLFPWNSLFFNHAHTFHSYAGTWVCNIWDCVSPCKFSNSKQRGKRDPIGNISTFHWVFTTQALSCRWGCCIVVRFATWSCTFACLRFTTCMSAVPHKLTASDELIQKANTFSFLYL